MAKDSDHKTKSGKGFNPSDKADSKLSGPADDKDPKSGKGFNPSDKAHSKLTGPPASDKDPKGRQGQYGGAGDAPLMKK